MDFCASLGMEELLDALSTGFRSGGDGGGGTGMYQARFLSLPAPHRSMLLGCGASRRGVQFLWANAWEEGAPSPKA